MSFIRIVCRLAVVAVANFIFCPPSDALIERNPAPAGQMQRARFEQYLSVARPEVVLLGNSLMIDSIDERGLSGLISARAIKIGRGGSASAWWYLALKNVILKAPLKPRVVVVFFRDHFLTDPGYRASGKYKQFVDAMADKDEPVLNRLAYLEGIDGMKYFLRQYFPLYQKRDDIKAKFETMIKQGCVSAPLGLEAGQVEASINNVFDEKNLNKELLTIRQLAAESVEDSSKYNFSKECKRSFLPHMIKLARQNNLQLIFVRMKSRRDLVAGSEPETLQKYIKELGAYLAKNDAGFVDFTHDERISIEYYGAGDHLNKTTGRQLFTQIVAEAIKPMIIRNRFSGQAISD